MDSGNKNSSHSRFPAKRRAINPDDPRSFRKMTEDRHIGQPQMQQGGGTQSKQQSEFTLNPEPKFNGFD